LHKKCAGHRNLAHHALSDTAHPCAVVEIPAFRARQKVGVADEDAADAAALFDRLKKEGLFG